MKKKETCTFPPKDAFATRKEWEKACLKKMLSFPRLLRSLITPKEFRVLTRRAIAVERIGEGKSYKQIGRELWMSPQTVSGIRKALRSKVYTSYWERSKTERKPFPKYRTFDDPLRRGRPHRTKYGTVYIR